MKILHVGWGFQPFRGGGLIEYAEDLMEMQVNFGYEVSYFCTGRFCLAPADSFVKQWKSNRGYDIFELWNPPIISGLELGVDQPRSDISETITERHFLDVLEQVKPDVVHFQEFVGVPTSLIKKAKELGIKTVFTIEDYFTLCPTLKLVKADGEICRIKDEALGRQCATCCVNAPRNNIKYKLFKAYPFLFNKKTLSVYRKLRRIAGVPKPQIDPLDENIVLDNNKIDEFNQRRAANLEVIKEADLLIGMSHKVTSIFSYYSKFENITTLHLTLKHLEHFTPAKYNNRDRVSFGVINAMGSSLKGKKLLLDVFERIDKSPLKEKLIFYLLGDLDDKCKGLIRRFKFVNAVGRFKVEKLNQLLDTLNINVGIVPSMWEEAYGYVGVEFLAKGIPVIGNNIGGIPDYTKDQETGWLNKTCSASELFEIINHIVDNPVQIGRLNQNLLDNRVKYIKSLDTHFWEMDAIYRSLLESESLVSDTKGAI